jgi:hypothetical protein
MPELLMERPKMSLQMHETLKRYILRERRRRIEEDVANEQKMREELVSGTSWADLNEIVFFTRSLLLLLLKCRKRPK